MPTPRFFYFDLGAVLLFFDHGVACRKLAALTGLDPAVIRGVIFESTLQHDLESGKISSQQFFEEFCAGTGATLDFPSAAQAMGDIFELNQSLKPVLSSLAHAGHRLGLLSNTCDLHWNQFGRGRYHPIPEIFDEVVLSYEVRSMKPDLPIYQEAIRRVGLAAEEIFFVDDRLDNVAGARQAGLDAVQYTTTRALVHDLRVRGVEFNY